MEELQYQQEDFQSVLRKPLIITTGNPQAPRHRNIPLSYLVSYQVQEEKDHKKLLKQVFFFHPNINSNISCCITNGIFFFFFK